MGVPEVESFPHIPRWLCSSEHDGRDQHEEGQHTREHTTQVQEPSGEQTQAGTYTNSSPKFLTFSI